MTSSREIKPKYKTYLFLCNENKAVYKILASKKDWKSGDSVTLPPLRVCANSDMLYGMKVIVRLYRFPIIYGKSGYIPKKTYKIKVRKDKAIILTIHKTTKK